MWPGQFRADGVERSLCGTPVIGLDIGGIPGAVRPGVTGLLVPAQDVDALRACIVQLPEDTCGRDKMSENCRRIV